MPTVILELPYLFPSLQEYTNIVEFQGCSLHHRSVLLYVSFSKLAVIVWAVRDLCAAPSIVELQQCTCMRDLLDPDIESCARIVRALHCRAYKLPDVFFR